ncbi:unnamed protein product, partial [Nesidiocoris tenuis]
YKGAVGRCCRATATRCIRVLQERNAAKVIYYYSTASAVPEPQRHWFRLGAFTISLPVCIDRRRTTIITADDRGKLTDKEGSINKAKFIELTQSAFCGVEYPGAVLSRSRP